MERKEIEEKVRNFLIDDLEIDEEKIADDALLKDDMGIDSLSAIILAQRLFLPTFPSTRSRPPSSRPSAALAAAMRRCFLPDNTTLRQHVRRSQTTTNKLPKRIKQSNNE